MKRALVLLMAAAGCESFDTLRDRAQCNNGLPSCQSQGGDGGVSDAGLTDAGQFDAGSSDAGAMDAGLDAGVDGGAGDAGSPNAEDAGVDGGAGDAGPLADAGPVDAGVDAGPVPVFTFGVSWRTSEGEASEPFPSDLVVNDAGVVLWFVSAFPTVDGAGRAAYFPMGYIVALDVAGRYLLADAGFGVRSNDAALSYQPSFHSPPNVNRGRASFSMTEIRVDGGRLLRSDGGVDQRGNLNSTAEIDLTRNSVDRELRAIGVANVPIAAGRLTIDGLLRSVYVAANQVATALIMPAESGQPARSLGGYACVAYPTDVVTTTEALADGGVDDRLLTLSLCDQARVLTYSQSVVSDLGLGQVTSARMAIAPEGTPGRAPFIALSTATAVRITRLDPGGASVVADVPLVSSGTIPQVQALTVDSSNRPFVVLGAGPNTSLVVDGVMGSVTSPTGLTIIQLTPSLALRWVSRVAPFDNEPLRATAAASSGRALMLAVECVAPPMSGASLCNGRLPTLIRVGPSPTFELP